ncbi:MAG: EAL domain-containing protein [Lachnospiraceae bacterium]
MAKQSRQPEYDQPNIIETENNDFMRKRIGLLLAQLEERTQRRFVSAFIKEAYEKDYDLCIFSMYQKYQETTLRNVGDSNIYSLVPYDIFDALIILQDTILTPDLGDKLQKRVKENFSGPVIVVDQKSDIFPYVLMDHYMPMRSLVDHLIEVHGYRDIMFLGGKVGHLHSLQRLNAYRDSLRSHGIPVREDYIFHGDYWYDSGARVAEKICQMKSLPQALCCANDYMAIGAGAVFEKNGIRIPEDMALVGYDSTQEGWNSPVPLTSASIPAYECGSACFRKIHAAITGQEEEKQKYHSKIMVGGSCGCTGYEKHLISANRKSWENDQSTESYYSDFNHITEDMLEQNEYDKFFRVVENYSHQIMPFHQFSMCLNENYTDPLAMVGENAIRHGYTENMSRVISIKGNAAGMEAGHGNNISLTEESDKKTFPTQKLIPELWEEREYPGTFIFNPLYFDDRCFGYTVVFFENEVCIYSNTYRVWIRNVMQGMEAFFRQRAMQSLLDKAKAAQIRDTDTGLYNYQGLRMKMDEMFAGGLDENVMGILSLDISNIQEINQIAGHLNGSHVIKKVSKVIAQVIDIDETCARVFGDEFVILFFAKDCEARSREIIHTIEKELKDYRIDHYPELAVSVSTEFTCLNCHDLASGEMVVNQTINRKNRKKEQRIKEKSFGNISQEEMEKCKLVEKLLDENKLFYHFQPIVSAQTGEIFAYEALMRCDPKYQLSPHDILCLAQKLNRLYDIERLTFFNVTEYAKKNKSMLCNRKMFINSMPAYTLQGEDKEIFAERAKNLQDTIVVEFTEESELTDKRLASMKKQYENMGIETAIDDYGSGYSNVNNLLRYMPKFVKIDRMLIEKVDQNPQKKHFVKSIIDFSKDNNILTLAEGVETTEELKTVIALGVDLIQGYYTAKPACEIIPQIAPEVLETISSINAACDISGAYQTSL